MSCSNQTCSWYQECFCSSLLTCLLSTVCLACGFLTIEGLDLNIVLMCETFVAFELKSEFLDLNGSDPSRNSTVWCQVLGLLTISSATLPAPQMCSHQASCNKWHGVNYGNRFIPEDWMRPEGALLTYVMARFSFEIPGTLINCHGGWTKIRWNSFCFEQESRSCSCQAVTSMWMHRNPFHFQLTLFQ
jgi:hypothetical protein